MKNYLVLVTFLLIALTASVSAQDLGKIDPAVQTQIGAALTAYYSLKDAMVDSNADAANLKSDDLLTALDRVDAAKMNTAQKTQWDKLSRSIRSDASHIKENEDLVHQRDHFVKLSSNMYSLVFGFKANETEAYLQYCPMKKASWLSDKKEIRNPYYGNKMLDCGSVKATLKTNK
ncbi:MAG: DUF3347 domain-containing protein [Acidobacteria bacterium]|nr:DUF3347 domain-containing protein [Acidobacteriota bacterium]